MKAARLFTCLATIALLRSCAFAGPTSRADAPVRPVIVVVDAGAPLDAAPADLWAPIVRAVPTHCIASDEPIRTDRITPDWVHAPALDPASDVGSRAIASIEGVHARHFQVEVLDSEGWVPAPATDCFRVTRREDRSVHFDLELSFANGHSCSVEDGDVVPLSTDRYRLQMRECAILLRRQGDEIVFDGEYPSSCATSATCGARGRIEGSRVPSARVRTCDAP